METDKSESNEHISIQSTVGNSFVEFLTVTVKYRWFLFWFVFIITVGATTYALLAPKWYKSTTSVLPAENTDFLSAFSGLSSLVKNFTPSKGLAALTGNTEFDKYMAILKSATMIDDVINRFDLIKEYDLENTYHEKVVKAFLSNLDMEVQDEGDLTITVYDKSAQKAADIANYMIAKLNEINTRISITNAKANREFIEKRYLQNVNDINHLESDMKDFQQKYGVVAVPQQIEATVKAMSTIYGELAQKEIAFNVLKRTYGEKSPLTSNAQIEVQEIQKKINSLNAGNGNSKDVNLLIPFKQAPELAYKYLKIYKDLEIQYKILEFVQPMYEQAKVEEARNTPSVLILDKATPADRKSKPKGSLYALISFVISILLGFFIVFVKEFNNKIKTTSPNKHSFITSALKSDLAKFGIKKKEKS
ncbi:MAG: Wzz/FepE/Etk N-terminal domain-containing protein [Bacteroidetes bacterium]|nr:Wzz/FepE/Etk N-terminal domain-containing protein [Bacteroidota bacterium]